MNTLTFLRSSPSRRLPRISAVAAAVQCLLMATAQAQGQPAAPTPRPPLPVTCAQTACTSFPSAQGASNAVSSFVAQGAGSAGVSGNTLTVNQTSSTALFNWRSFDIARDHAVHFNQQAGRSAVAINRIHDSHASRIDGRLTATGQVYLINPNGLLFGSGASVDVGGLIASTLDINPARIDSGLLGRPSVEAAFSVVNSSQARGAGVDIEPGARIHAGVTQTVDNRTVTQAGSVFVFAPRVSNEGAITVTPGGQVVLAAGERIYLAGSDSATLRGLLVEVGQGGVVSHRGEISTPRGDTTMVGMAVNQSGRITATSAINENGSIRLLAREVSTASLGAEAIAPQPGAFLRTRTPGRVDIGSGSSTVVALDVSDSGTAPLNDANAAAARSTISAEGREIVVGGSAQPGATLLQARGGDVMLQARSDLDVINSGASSSQTTLGRDSANTTLTVGSDVRIDVSGERDVAVDGARNYVYIDRLTSNELRDAPLQRDGFLRGQGVHLNVAQDHAFIDVSNRRDAVAGTQAERNATGGLIALRAEGRVEVAAGAVLDVSGGTTRTSAAVGRTSQLVTETGRVVDIANARADERYVGFADRYTSELTAPREGVDGRRSFDAPVLTASAERVDGRAAGTVEINAPRGQMAGTLQGQAFIGTQQRAAPPAGGRLLLGSVANSATLVDSQINYLRPHVLLTNTLADAAFQVPGSQADNFLAIDTEALRNGGFTRLDVRSDGVLTVAPGATLDAGPGGSLALRGAQVNVSADLRARGGDITVGATVRTVPGNPPPLVSDEEAGAVRFGRGVVLDASGTYTNDLSNNMASPSGAATPVLRNGGNITVAGRDVDVAGVSLVNVDAGASVSATGAAMGGRAGSVSITSGTSSNQIGDPTLGALNLGEGFSQRVRGFGFTAGGSLSLAAPRACLGSNCAQDGVTAFDLGLLDQGFETFTFRGLESLVVSNNTVLAPTPRLYGFRPDQALPPTGTNLAQTLTPQAALPGAERASRINLQATPAGGWVRIGQGAVVDAGAGGAVQVSAGQSIVHAGTLVARGGQVTMALSTAVTPENVEATLRRPDATSQNFEQRAVHLAAGSVIEVSGVSRVQTDATGRRSGVVLDGGSVNLNAGLGHLAVDAGARIAADGAVGSVDLRQGANLVRTEVASRGGAVALRAQNSLFVQGDIHARAGNSNVEGGRLSVSFQGLAEGRREDTASDPQRLPLFDSTYRSDRVLSITEQATLLPEPGRGFSAENYAGRGQIRPDLVNNAGFDTVQLFSSNTIAIPADTALATANVLSLDAQALSLGAGATLNLSAPRLSLGFSQGGFVANLDAAASGGSGRLNLQARQVDLVGQLSLQGVGQTQIQASGDVSLRGVNSAAPPRLAGSLQTAGSVNIEAAQLAPVSMTDYRFDLGTQAGTRLTLRTPDGAAALEPLSAAGSVTVAAPDIEIDGRIHAPHGRIALQAGEQLRLGANARLSVAGSQDVPLGTLFNGNQWVYANNASDPNNDLVSANRLNWPDKGIALNSPTVLVDPAAQLGVSGGGRVVTQEFVSGPGGSVDWRLNNLTSTSAAGTSVTRNPYFALLPTRGDAPAPYDAVAYSGLSSNAALGGSDVLRPGQTITLAAGSGIPAGTYTVMPPSYALLPGAYAVQAAAGYADFTPGARVAEPVGSVVVAGRLGVAGAAGEPSASTTRWSGWRVLTGAQFRRLAEWNDASADALLANAARAGQNNVNLPRTPLDAGTLQLDAAQQVQFDLASLRAAPGRSGSGAQAITGRGADLTFAAPNLLVNDQPAPASSSASDTLALPAQALSAVGAERLLLGGAVGAGTDTTTSGAPGSLTLDTRANTVSVGGAQPLAAGEVLLAARERVSVAPGASIVATGSAQPLERVNSQGDGAALLVGAADTLPVWSRSGATGTQGDLSLAPSASLTGRSVVFDASREQSLASSLAVQATNLGLSAARINLGEAPAGTAGLLLSNEVLARLSQVEQLTLSTSSGINVYGDVSLGSSALQRLALDGAGLLGATTDAGLTITAGDVFLRNSSNATAASSSSSSSSSLTITAQAGNGTNSPNGTISLTGGDFQFAGFANYRLQAQSNAGGRDNTGQIRLAGTGHLQASGDLSLAAARITGARGATQRVTATGVLATEASGADTADTTGELGASLTLASQRVDHAGRIVAPSGLISLAATGADRADGVRLREGSVLDAGGSTQRFAQYEADASAGTVRLSAAAGSVRADAGSRIQLSGSGQQGDAGTLQVQAAQGELALQGSVLLAPGSQAQGAAVQIDVGRLPSLDTLAQALNSGNGSTNATASPLRQLDVRVRQGGTTLSTSQNLAAQQMRIAADGGDGRLRIEGQLDASGGRAGRVELHAGQSIVLGSASRIDAASSGIGQEGGTVLLSARIAPQPISTTLDAVVINNGAQVNVSGGADAPGGVVTLRAPWQYAPAAQNQAAQRNDVAIAALPDYLHGARSEVIEATYVPVLSITQSNLSLSNTGAASAANPLPTWRTNLQNYTTPGNVSAIGDRLGRSGNTNFDLRPGLEVRTSGNITVTGDIDFTSGLSTGNFQWRYGGNTLDNSQPGALTLRAGGNLTVGGSLLDGYVTSTTPGINANATLTPFAAGQDSWRYQLTGGADLSGASAAAMQPAPTSDSATGNLRIQRSSGSQGIVVRTGTGRIDLAAAGDIELGGTTGSRDVAVFTGGQREAEQPVFANFTVRNFNPNFTTHGGGVRAEAGRDIRFNQASNQLVNNWLFRAGRATEVSAEDGSVALDFTGPANAPTAWWVNAGSFLQGLGALGGGDLSVSAGRDLLSVTAAVPSQGYLDLGRPGSNPVLSERNGGDLSAQAGGTVSAGVYYAQRGDLNLRGDRIGPRSIDDLVFLAQGNNTARVQSRLELDIFGSFNPTLVQIAPFFATSNAASPTATMFSTYGDSSRLDLYSWSDDVTLRGAITRTRVPDPVAGAGVDPRAILQTNNRQLLFALPSTVDIVSFGGDLVMQDASRLLWPSSQGQLRLLADGSISSGGLQTSVAIGMGAIDPLALPRAGAPLSLDAWNRGRERNVLLEGNLQTGALRVSDNIYGLNRPQNHGSSLLHANDTAPAAVVARDGNIQDLALSVPKALDLQAAGDIVNTTLFTQNVRDSDVSRVHAGGRIANLQLDATGPGLTEVLAGRDIDLGSGTGLVSRGNLVNPNLPQGGADLLVAAGLGTTAQGFVQRPDAQNLLRQFVRHDAYAVAGQGSDALNRATIEALGLSAQGRAVLLEALTDREQALQSGSAFDTWLQGLGEVQQTRLALRLTERVQATLNQRFVGNRNTESFASGYAMLGDLFPSLNANAQGLRHFVSDNPFAVADDAQALQQQALQGLPADVRAALELGLAAPASVNDANSAFNQALAALPREALDAGARQLQANVQQVAGLATDALRAANRLDANVLTPFARGLDAQARAFVPSPGTDAAHNIQLVFSQIKTEQSGQITLATPRGGVVAGLANPPVGGPDKKAFELGVLSLGGGGITTFARDNFDVFRSRVFTVAGGDVHLWAGLGNIDAGRGPRDVTVAPPPRLVIDPETGIASLDIGASVSGSGIGALRTRENQPPSDIRLMAPNGFIDAGEAGIRADSGSITLGTNLVINPGNIVGSGGVSGGAVAIAPPAPVPQASNTQQAEKAVEQAKKALEEQTREAEERQKKERRKRVTGEFLGFGEGP
jgi:filamentous hemagglutinin